MREDRNIRQMRLQAGPTALFPRRAWIVGILNQNDPESDKLLDELFGKNAEDAEIQKDNSSGMT